jgi:hypothetical protein
MLLCACVALSAECCGQHVQACVADEVCWSATCTPQNAALWVQEDSVSNFDVCTQAQLARVGGAWLRCNALFIVFQVWQVTVCYRQHGSVKAWVSHWWNAYELCR